MAKWTQQELDRLMAKMTKMAMTDAEFRKELLADATAALEKLAGKALPEGATLKCIEKDPNYQTTLVLPDLVDEEKLDDESLTNVAGGISVAAIVTICAAAAGIGPDAGFCLYKACAADACIDYVGGHGACGAQACYTDKDVNGCGAKSCSIFGD